LVSTKPLILFTAGSTNGKASVKFLAAARLLLPCAYHKGAARRFTLGLRAVPEQRFCAEADQ
jgi:hypothetical protein